MADTRIIVLDYRRSTAFGLTRIGGAWALHMDKDDVLQLSIDWSRWLDGETISSTTYTANNITTSGAAEASGITTVTLSVLKGDPATVDAQVTTSGGRKLTMAVRVYEAANVTTDVYAA